MGKNVMDSMSTTDVTDSSHIDNPDGPRSAISDSDPIGPVMWSREVGSTAPGPGECKMFEVPCNVRYCPAPAEASCVGDCLVDIDEDEGFKWWFWKLI